MVLSIIIACITCLFLILSVLFKPKIKIKNIEIQTFWIVSLIGALLILICGLLPFNLLAEKLMENSIVNPIKILVLFISMSMISITLDTLGFFKYLASKILSIFNSSQYKLFFSLYILISILTIFTSNDIVILTFTPFICYFSKNAKISPIPYLVMEFVVANTYSMMLSIGNPTNIYLSQACQIGFFDYFKIMALPTLFAGLTSVLVLLLLFRKSLNEKIENIDVEISKIENKPLTIISLIILISCTIMLAISNYINIEMWIICLCALISLSIIILIFSIKEKNINKLKMVYSRLPYNLIFFVLSMFIIVLALNHNGVTSNISSFIHKYANNNISTSFIFGIVSTLSDNLINNIPMSILFSSILSNGFGEAAIYSTIIGSNLGAYLTPIGALAGIMWMSILKKQEIEFSFKKFTMYGIILVPFILLASILGLIIIL